MAFCIRTARNGLKVDSETNNKREDFNPPVHNTSEELTMHNKNNNTNKDSGMPLSPEDPKKCFFAIENEFMQFEIVFISNQLKRRSNIKLDGINPLRPYGIDFLYWFLDSIHNDLGIAGKTLSQTILAKLSRFTNNKYFANNI